jgi:hypothetical protein
MVTKLQQLTKYMCLFAGVALLAIPATAQLPSLFPQPTAGPQSIEFNFSTPLSIANTTADSPGSWYQDRYPPCLFSSMETAPDGTKNTLEESICASALQPQGGPPDPGFFNTQGRKYDLVANTTTMSINLYVPSSWGATPGRFAGFWGTAADSAGVIGNDYPIIEFQGPTPSTPVITTGAGFYPNGGVAGFYGWNNAANGGNGGWDYIGLPPGFQYNSWVTLTITTVPGTGYEYKVTDANSRRGVSIQSPFYDSTETSISNVILEAYNYGASYNVFWNNLSFVSSSFQCSPKSTQPQQSGLFGLLGVLLQQQQHLLNHPW